MTVKRKHWFYELIPGASLIVVVESDGKRQFSAPLWLFQELGVGQWLSPETQGSKTGGGGLVPGGGRSHNLS